MNAHLPAPPAPPNGVRSAAGQVDRVAVLILIIGIACTMGAYGKSFHAPFTLDDSSALFQTPAIRSPWTAWQGTSSRRFVNLTFAFNYYFDGHRVIGYHAVNLGIHLAAGLLLFGLLRRTFDHSEFAANTRRSNARIAAAAAVVWLVHPLQTQSVTYVVQRYESLMGCLLIGSLYCLSRSSTSSRSVLWNIACVVSAWLSLESKESAIVLPLLAVTYDRVFLSRSWRDLWRRRGFVHVGLAATAAYLMLRSSAVFDTSSPATAGFGATTSTPWQYLTSQAGVILHYLRLSYWPDVLCIDYRWPIASEWSAIFLPGLAIVGLLGTSVWGILRGSRLSFLGIGFFLLLAVTSSFIPIDDLAVEHRMYLPLACVASFTVIAVHEVVRRTTDSLRLRLVILGSLLVTTVAALSVRTFVRNADYADPLRLWSKALEVNPGNARAHCYVGRLLGERGEFVEAERHLLTALEIAPRSFTARAQLGYLATHRNDIPRALAWYEEALRVRPNFVKVMILIGDLHRREGRSETALEWYRKASDTQPDNAEAWKNQGRLLMESGQYATAEVALRNAARLNPRDEISLGRLAWLLATEPDSPPDASREALAIAEKLARRKDYGALQILAAAQASCGDFERAVATTQEALRLAKSVGDSPRVDLLQSHLKAYRVRRRAETAEFSPAAGGRRPTVPVRTLDSDSANRSLEKPSALGLSSPERASEFVAQEKRETRPGQSAFFSFLV